MTISTVLRFRRGRVCRAALFLTGLASLAWSQGAFVQSSNGALTLGGAPFRFGGTNSYPLMLSSRQVVDQVLTTAQSDNLAVLRMWAFCDGIQCDGGPFYLQYWNSAAGAPAYNDTASGLANVDYAIYRAGQLGIKLIIPFTNNWPDYGGMDTYVTWNGGKYHDQFYTDSTIRQWYKNWISHVLNHVNQYSHLAYKDDPAIMAWELANEPECGASGLPKSGACTSDTMISWIKDVSAYVKTIDFNHLVSVGDEGFFCSSTSCAAGGNGVDSDGFSAVESIDLVGFHLYPDSWGASIAWGEAFIAQHESEAANLVKPLYMGEFGLLAANAKVAVYNDWTNLIFNGGGSGAMFWALMPGTPGASAAEAESTYTEEAGSPVLPLMGGFAQIMAAGAALPLSPVAGNQWANAAFNEPVTLNVVSNSVAYDGATIDPSTIDLDPNTQGQQTSLTVDGGVFQVVDGAIQFAPNTGFTGSATGSYTVADSNQQVSNTSYMFVTVNPLQTGWAVLESFESGTGGWGPELSSGAAGTVTTSPLLNTEGKYSLQVNATSGGWFGVSFPNPVDLPGWPSLAIDVSTTSVGGYSAIAFQSGSNWIWCQSSSWVPLNLFSTTTLALRLQASAYTCYGGTPDLTKVRSLYVSLGNPGTYYLDNLRAAAAIGASAPLPKISGVANAAGWQAGVSAGTYISIYGSNFAPSGSTPAVWSDYVSNGQLPTTLAGVSVSMGGSPAYVYYVSPAQINVLAPSVGTGSTSVTVTNAAGTSAAYNVQSAAVQPAFFEWGSYAVATDAHYHWLVKNGTFPGTTTAPAHPGDTIILWGTGFGATTPAAPSGQVTPANIYGVSGVTVTIGGVQATNVVTALSPGSAGLYQVNLTVPSNLANGDYSVIAAVNGVSSPTGVELTVQK